MLERHCEVAGGRSQTAQIVLRRSRVNDALTELRGEPSGGHMDVNKTLNKLRSQSRPPDQESGPNALV
jgi:hypothetical protein